MQKLRLDSTTKRPDFVAALAAQPKPEILEVYGESPTNLMIELAKLAVNDGLAIEPMTALMRGHLVRHEVIEPPAREELASPSFQHQ